MKKILIILIALLALNTSIATAQPAKRKAIPNTAKKEITRATTASAITTQYATGMTPEELVNNVFLGNGVEVSNVKFNGISTSLTTGNGLQLGLFTADTLTYTFPTHFFSDGLIMTTGKIIAAEGPNSSDSYSDKLNYSTTTCSELQALVSQTIFKPAVLEFDFTTVADHVSFNYIFASEEYPEFVNEGYNDVFGFFVTDLTTNIKKNIALIPGTNSPVSIDNVNAGAHSSYYHPIASGSSLMEYDAYVGPFVAEMDVVPCRTYHMKLAIANAGDNAWDSGVFLKAASFSAPNLGGSLNYEYEDQQYLVPGCYNEAYVTFSLPHPVQNDSTILLNYGGTAVNGVDLTMENGQPLPTSIIMPAGDSTYVIPVVGVDDGQYHGDTVSLFIQYENIVCGISQIGKIEVTLIRDAGIGLSSSNISACDDITSMSVNLDYGTAENIQWSPATNLTNPHSLTTGFINPPSGTTQYTVTAKDKYGCKTAQTSFTLNIVEPQYENYVDYICQGGTYTEHGFNIVASEAGNIKDTIEIQIPGNSCRNYAVIDLTVNPTEAYETAETECDSYTWINGTQETYTQSGIYTYKAKTTEGCDSTVTLHLTINHNDSSYIFTPEPACNSYSWKGETYTQSGYYHYDTVTVNGCDSIMYLDLTVYHDDLTGIETITTCDTYKWKDQEFDESGTHTFDTITTHGCDSTVTLYLTINHSNLDGNVTETACDSYTWNGQEYTQSGDYLYETQTTHGCDSAATLHLTIKHSTSSEEYRTECDSYYWNGQEYTQSGDYTHLTTNASGCDSTATLHLTVNYSEYPVTNEKACNQYIWKDQELTQSGSYTHETVTSNGCERIETLNLTIVETPDIKINGTRWPIGGSETSFSVYNYNILSLTNATEYDSVIWTLGCPNWYVEPHNNGMDADVHIFTWIPDSIQLTATAYNECGESTNTIWLRTSYYGIDEKEGNIVSITPNPNNGNMKISLDESISNALIKVFDNTGKQVDSFTVKGKSTHYSIPAKTSGIYHFLIIGEEKTIVKKVVVK